MHTHKWALFTHFPLKRQSRRALTDPNGGVIGDDATPPPFLSHVRFSWATSEWLPTPHSWSYPQTHGQLTFPPKPPISRWRSKDFISERIIHYSFMSPVCHLFLKNWSMRPFSGKFQAQMKHVKHDRAWSTSTIPHSLPWHKSPASHLHLRRDMPSYVHLFGDQKGLFIPLGEALSILSKIVSRTLKPQAYFIALHLTAVKQDRDEERTAAKVH